MEYDELIECLRHHCGHVSLAICTSEREQAADAITKLRAERDFAMEMVNVQDNKIDALRALLREVLDCDQQAIPDWLANDIDAALKEGK